MQAGLTSLMLDIRSGEDCIVIGDLVRVELVHKSGSAARIRVMAPREVVIKKESIEYCLTRTKHGAIDGS